MTLVQLEAICYLANIRVIVWDPLGNELYRAGSSGRVCHLGYHKQHYVVVRRPGKLLQLMQLLSRSCGRSLCLRGGSPTRRATRRSSREGSQLRLRSRSPPTARDWHMSKASQVKAIDELDFTIEKTWLVMRKWGVGTQYAGWDVFCTACSRWADGMHRRSRRHGERILNAGPREVDHQHDPADVPLREAVASTQRLAPMTSSPVNATVSLVSRAEREASQPTRMRGTRSQSPPLGWVPARRDPDLHPMDALVAASLAAVPGCDLATEKSWLFYKSFEADGIHKRQLFCSLCNHWASKTHRLSPGHSEKVNRHGDRNLYMRVKAEPHQPRDQKGSWPSSSGVAPVRGGQRGGNAQAQSHCTSYLHLSSASWSSLPLGGSWTYWAMPWSITSCYVMAMVKMGITDKYVVSLLPCYGGMRGGGLQPLKSSTCPCSMGCPRSMDLMTSSTSSLQARSMASSPRMAMNLATIMPMSSSAERCPISLSCRTLRPLRLFKP